MNVNLKTHAFENLTYEEAAILLRLGEKLMNTKGEYDNHSYINEWFNVVGGDSLIARKSICQIYLPMRMLLDAGKFFKRALDKRGIDNDNDDLGQVL